MSVTKGTTFVKFGPIPTEEERARRHAVATGSVHDAMWFAEADFNGHHVNVSFKPHAVSGPIWNAEYWWAGRNVLGRGSFDRCLCEAELYMHRGHKGSICTVHYDPTDNRTDMQVDLDYVRSCCLMSGYVEIPEGTEYENYNWYKCLGEFWNKAHS
jgi:hypothetical protein